MSSSSPTPRQTGTAKATGKPVPKVNRSQIRAMESRAASTPMDQFSLTGDDVSELSTARAGSSAISRKKPVQRTFFLSRAQEYGHIRADMKRLIITASGLFVVMLALLVILD